MSSPCIDDRAKYGVGLVEDGVNDYKEWSNRMRADLAPHSFTDGELTKLYAESKAWRAQELDARAANTPMVRTNNDAFINNVANSLNSWQNAAKFTASLTEPDGTTPILDKLASGTKLDELIGDEQKRVAQAWNDARPEKQVKPNVSPMNDFIKSAAELRKYPTGKGTPLENLMGELRRQVGIERANTVRANLAENGKDNILSRLATGGENALTPAERLKLRSEMSKAAAFEPPTDTEADEAAQALKQAQAQARQLVRRQLASSRDAVDHLTEWAYKNLAEGPREEFLDSLQKVSPDDHPGFARLMHQYAPQTFSQKAITLYRSGLLSKASLLGRIAISHAGFLGMEGVSQVPAAIIDSVLSAVTGNDRTTHASFSALTAAAKDGARQGFKDMAYSLANGHDALTMKRIQSGDRSLLAQMGSRVPEASEVYFKNAGVQTAMNVGNRLHGGFYEPAKGAAAQGALYSQAIVVAKAEARALAKGGASVPKDYVARRTQELYDNPTETMSMNAIAAAEEATFTNDNRFTEGYNRFKGKQTPTVRAFMDFMAPFVKVPANIIIRTLEYNGGGLVSGLMDMAHTAIKGERMSPELQASIAKRFGRSATGIGIIVAGNYLAQAGLITPPYGVRGRSGDKNPNSPPGSININGKWYPLMGLGPLGGMLLEGAGINYIARHGKQGQTSKPAMMTLAATYGDQPMYRVMDTGRQLQESPNAAIGYKAASVVPGIASDIAKGLDHNRKVKLRSDTLSHAVVDNLKANIPRLRDTLPGQN